MSEMTVNELVKQLQGCLPDSPVLIKVPMLDGGTYSLRIRTVQTKDYLRDGQTIQAVFIETFPLFGWEDGQ